MLSGRICSPVLSLHDEILLYRAWAEGSRTFFDWGPGLSSRAPCMQASQVAAGPGAW